MTLGKVQLERITGENLQGITQGRNSSHSPSQSKKHHNSQGIVKYSEGVCLNSGAKLALTTCCCGPGRENVTAGSHRIELFPSNLTISQIRAQYDIGKEKRPTPNKIKFAIFDIQSENFKKQVSMNQNEKNQLKLTQE